MVERLSRAWVATAFLLLLLTTTDFAFQRVVTLTDYFFRSEDLPVLAAISAAAAVLWFAPAARRIARATSGRAFAIARGLVRARPRPRAAAAVIAVLAGVIALAGVYMVFGNYPLSMDEFLATFDAAILGHGQLVAPVAPPWRPFAGALAPMFMVQTSGAAFWVSAYLPVNAALRALAGVLGAAVLVNPALAAFSVITLYALGVQLWPGRRDLALVAAVLLATSSQFLVTAMTPYAMTAHLALNLAWLWLFLRGGVTGHAGAIAVAFLACGLHQIVFHPLFAAPFVLQLWLDRRWRTAALYTLAYAAICLFWTFYWPMALAVSGAPAAAASGLGAHWLTVRTLGLLAGLEPAALGLTAKNLIRLMTWQNPLAVALAVVGFAPALRAGGTLRSLALGAVLTTVAMAVLLAYQGHGWGYRYLHGLLGSLCLVAAFGWKRLTDRLAQPERADAIGGFAAVALACVLILLPLRALQAHRFARPYGAAHAAIAAARAEVVVVDALGTWFGEDLVRNDPYLRDRPLVMNLGSMDEGEIRSLCGAHDVTLFTPADAHAFGIRTLKPPAGAATARALALRREMATMRCGRPMFSSYSRS